MLSATRNLRRTLALLTAALAMNPSLAALVARDEPEQAAIAGSWVVESVESAGEPVSGLKGAKLVLFPDGKKQFHLPGGVVESGAYTIDAATQPLQIDSTTEGKPAKQRGIISLEGDILKICLSAQGPRPTKFATQKGADQLLIVLNREPTKPKPAPDEPKEPKTPRISDEPNAPLEKPTGSRRFRMGFTGFVYDITPEAVASSRKFVREHGDIIAHRIEGVPWAEAMSGQPFPKAVLDSWEGKKAATPTSGKVYLAISPGRGELKVQDKAGPLPKELIDKTYTDPLVMKTYLAYCRRAIEFFQPDYLCIGIEVNEIHRDGGGQKWKAYAA